MLKNRIKSSCQFWDLLLNSYREALEIVGCYQLQEDDYFYSDEDLISLEVCSVRHIHHRRSLCPARGGMCGFTTTCSGG